MRGAQFLAASGWPSRYFPFLATNPRCRLLVLHKTFIHSPISTCLSRSGNLRTISGHFFQVVNDTEEIPLDIYLLLSAQGETI